MPRTNTPATARKTAARTTAHAASSTAPARTADPAPASPSGAVHAALTASPGATTAAIADAVGIGRAAARDALTALETAGTVTRTKGGKPGIPDTWTLAAGQQAPEDPRPDHEDGHAAQPGDSPAAEDPGGPGRAEAAEGASDEDDSAPASPGRQDDDVHADSDRTVSDPAGGQGTVSREGQSADPVLDAALVADIAGRIEQIKATASAAAIILSGSENPRGALAGLDEIYEQATEGRRVLKAALGGKKAPAIRSGGLRDKILAHLRDHPGQDFTPHEIHKVINHSSGAIANALDTLVKHGHAELGSEKPRKFHLAGGVPAGHTGGPDNDTELAEPGENAA